MRCEQIIEVDGAKTRCCAEAYWYDRGYWWCKDHRPYYTIEEQGNEKESD